MTVLSPSAADLRGLASCDTGHSVTLPKWESPFVFSVRSWGFDKHRHWSPHIIVPTAFDIFPDREVLVMSGKDRIGLAIDALLAVVSGAILSLMFITPPTGPELHGLAYLAVGAAVLAPTVDYLLPAFGWESVGVAVALAALMALGRTAAILAACVPVAVFQLRARLTLRELISRASRVIVATAAATMTYPLLGGQVGGIRSANFWGVTGAMLTYFGVNLGIRLARDERPSRDSLQWTRPKVGWALIHGSLIITWATLSHALVVAWGNGLLVFFVPAAFSLSALALVNFYQSQNRAVAELAGSLGQRYPLYPGHVEHVLQYSEAIARQLGVSDRELADIRLAAALCDIGQSKVPADFVQQARPLTAEERSRLAEHVLAGVALIARIPVLSHIVHIVRAHHEWYNGLGYPGGLRGARIPVAARIIAVADAFDAMTSFRPYRRMMTPAEALEVIEANAGGQFCPRVVAGLRAFIRKSAGGSPPQRPADQSEVGLTVYALRNYVRRVTAVSGASAGDSGQDWVFSGLSALGDLTAIMTSSLDIDRVLDVAVRIMNDLTGTRCGIILLGEHGEIEKTYDIAAMPHLGRLPEKVTLLDDAVKARAPVIVAIEEIASAEMQAALRASGVRQMVTVPLLCRGRAIGGAFVRVPQDRQLGETELNMLTLVASQVALAVENARLYGETASRLHEISDIQALNRGIIENTSTGIIAVDSDGIVTLVSRPAILIMGRIGYVMPDGTGWSYPDWARSNGLDSQLVRCLSASEGCDLYSAPVAGPAGVAHFHIHITVLRDESGAVSGLTDIFNDVTEQWRMEQRILETEKLSALAQLAGGAAHEIRNPLASVRGFVQLMQRRQAPDDGMGEYMGIILSEIDRIDGIISELLQLSRPAPPAKTDLPLRRLLDEVCLLMGTGAMLHEIDLVKAYPHELPELQADGNQLKQVFINIITNAIQATPYGGRIAVDAGCDGGEAWVRISDTGVGISPERVSRIFEPFYTTKENGTGLGLTVCYSIVSAHGGRIDVDSAPGSGTTFTVRLPLAAGGANAI